MTTKKELKGQIENLKSEIDGLKILTNVGNMEGFDLIIAKIKDEMIANVKEEDWKTFKQNKSKIEKMRGFTDYIEKQTEIIEDKEKELKNLEYQFENFKISLFDKEEEKEATGFFYGEEKGDCDSEIYTGDILDIEIEGEDGLDMGYTMIARSSEKPENFAIIGTFFEDEKLLQYPANRTILDECDYIGNIYDDPQDEQLKQIVGYFKSNNETSEEKGE